MNHLHSAISEGLQEHERRAATHESPEVSGFLYLVLRHSSFALSVPFHGNTALADEADVVAQFRWNPGRKQDPLL